MALCVAASHVILQPLRNVDADGNGGSNGVAVAVAVFSIYDAEGPVLVFPGPDSAQSRDAPSSPCGIAGVSIAVLPSHQPAVDTPWRGDSAGAVDRVFVSAAGACDAVLLYGVLPSTVPPTIME